jgi:hypothetical protein
MLARMSGEITAFRYRTAVETGASRGRIRGALDRGQLVRLARGVYAGTAARLDEIAAAVLRLGDDAVVSHETAAELWGLPVLGRPPATVHITKARRHAGISRYPGITVHHAAMPAGHHTVHNGIRLATPARTVTDRARARSFRAGVAAADAALRWRRCTRADLLAVARDCAGWPGVRRARGVAAFADPAAASPLESISRVAFREYGLPRPLLQAELACLDVVDFLWEAYGVVGEADGMMKYADADVLRTEKLRQERIEQDGLVVVRWTWAEAYRRPDVVAYRVESALRRRGWRPGPAKPGRTAPTPFPTRTKPAWWAEW